MQRGAPKRRAVAKRVGAASTPSTTASGLKLDAQGRLIADVEPTKKFPLKSDLNFVDTFQRKLEDDAQQVRSREAANGAEVARVLDGMKATPIQNLSTNADMFRRLWTGSEANEELEPSSFFTECLLALEKDLTAHARLYVGENSPANPGLPPWEHPDPDLDLYTDSEEESDGRLNRFAPPVRCLRRICRRVSKQDQQRMIVLKAMSMLKKKTSVVEVKARLREERISSHDSNALHKRLEYRTSQRAADIARYSLSMPLSLGAPVKLVSLKKSFVSLFRFLLAQRFPDCLRINQLREHAVQFEQNGSVSLAAFDQGCRFTIESNQILASLSKYREIDELRVTEEGTGELYIANLGTALDVPFGDHYRNTQFMKDFAQIVKSFKEFQVLQKDEQLSVRPRSRQLRSAAVTKLNEALAGKKAMHVQVNQTSTAEFQDSDADEEEAAQMAAETKAVKRIVAEGGSLAQDGEFSAFGPEHTHVRLGGEHGQLRNQFDVNRRRAYTLEALAKDEHTVTPVVYESSEDENIPFADYQRKYRARFRLFKNPVKQQPASSRTAEAADPEFKWPGSVLDGYRRRLREQAVAAAAAAEGESPNKKAKKRSGRLWRGQTFTLNPRGEQVVVEESWKTMSIKPRVRMIEPRFDRGGDRPLGFLSRARDLSGSENQLMAIDEGELHRRFALNKLWQTSMAGRDHVLANRKYFALVINEEEHTARVVPAHPTKLIYTESPREALENFSWELYWQQIRSGALQNRLNLKALRYKELAANNFIVWKDGLEKYQKLRERVSELQTHESPQSTKLKLLARTPQIAAADNLETPEMAAHYNPESADVVNKQWISRNEKAVEFKKKIALRTRALITQTNTRASRRYKSMYQEYRRHIAERTLYEQSWVSSKAKRSTEATLAASTADE